ncbi:MAG: hypothetical protein LUQ59_00735 [Methanothrix sp.]|nr:hypothetical protein [Methanothrix sp.]
MTIELPECRAASADERDEQEVKLHPVAAGLPYGRAIGRVSGKLGPRVDKG